jgi:thiamine pyrophosphokinase
MPAEGSGFKTLTLQAEGFLMDKRAILFANGEVESYDFLEKLITDKDYLVAVDGGLRHLEALGLPPDLLIGDLDSVTPAQLQGLPGGQTEIVRFPIEKDETDLELALVEVVKRGMEEIVIIGGLGRRIDQSLANLFLLLLPDLTGKNAYLLTQNEKTFLIQKGAVIHGREGDIVSLIPLKGDASGVTTIGLQYPLTSETLRFEHSRGISNRMLSDKAEVQVIDGVLLCVQSWNSENGEQ